MKNKEKKQKLLFFTLSLLLIVGFGWICESKHFLWHSPIGLRVNVSDSLPYSYFLSFPLSALQKEKIISFSHPSSNVLLAKVIKGLPGDRISLKGSQIYVNNFNCGICQESSTSGKIYHPIHEGVIPNGYLFVYSPHINSFDSRYTEIGLIPIHNIKEVLWPIL